MRPHVSKKAPQRSYFRHGLAIWTNYEKPRIDLTAKKRIIINCRVNQQSMEWRRSGEDIFVRLDPGDEIHESLQKLANEAQFNAAAITSGIGRTRDNLYGYMDDDGIYQRRKLEPPSELVSLSGNIARKEDGSAFTHIHCCWSDNDLKPHAGHMFECTVAVVAEIHLRVMSEILMTRCPLPGVQLLGLQFS